MLDKAIEVPPLKVVVSKPEAVSTNERNRMQLQAIINDMARINFKVIAKHFRDRGNSVYDQVEEPTEIELNDITKYRRIAEEYLQNEDLKRSVHYESALRAGLIDLVPNKYIQEWVKKEPIELKGVQGAQLHDIAVYYRNQLYNEGKWKYK